MKNTCIIIPTYEPNEVLIEVINGIIQIFYSKNNKPPSILLINDGSKSLEAKKVFESVKQDFKNINVVDLKKNLGKGDAIKAGLKYIEKSMPQIDWIVTADADGQHLAHDIVKIVNAGKDNHIPVLGIRSFDKGVPFRSKLGNNITKSLFKILYGGNILDTQTGLRGFSRNLVPELLKIKARKYAFETQMLIQFIKIFEVRQIQITTVYEPKNPTSHFHPIFDSLQIYWVFLRHIISGFLAVCVEVSIFYIFTKIGYSIEHALIIGRLFAGIFLFLMARSIVFKKKSKLMMQIVKYISLTILHLIMTIWIVEKFLQFKIFSQTVSLFAAYLILFLLSFIIQKTIIFRSK